MNVFDRINQMQPMPKMLVGIVFTLVLFLGLGFFFNMPLLNQIPKSARIILIGLAVGIVNYRIFRPAKKS